MKNADDIKRIFEQAVVETNPSKDEKILETMMAAYKQTGKAQSEKIGPNIWRIIMRNPITKLAAATVIILAVIMGIYYFGGSIDMSSRVWADVVQRAHKARTFAYTQTVHYSGVAELPDMKMEVIYKEPGYQRRTFGEFSVSITDLLQRKGIVINHSQKQYTEIDLSSEEKVGPANSDFFERMRTLPEQATENLGEKEINGRNAIGYRVIEKGMDVTFWVDVKSRDLVLSEVRFVNAPGVYSVVSDFRFDIEVDDSLFSLKPPEGYKPLNLKVDNTEVGEKDLVEFLRFWTTQVSDGNFPPSLNPTELAKAALEMKKEGTKIKADTEEEKMQYGLRMTRGLTFFIQLGPESDWHYAGSGVKLGDAGKAIFWYKPKDSQTWRVIYGDLSVKDVNEQGLPK